MLPYSLFSIFCFQSNSSKGIKKNGRWSQKSKCWKIFHFIFFRRNIELLRRTSTSTWGNVKWDAATTCKSVDCFNQWNNQQIHQRCSYSSSAAVQFVWCRSLTVINSTPTSDYMPPTFLRARESCFDWLRDYEGSRDTAALGKVCRRECVFMRHSVFMCVCVWVAINRCEMNSQTPTCVTVWLQAIAKNIKLVLVNSPSWTNETENSQ